MPVRQGLVSRLLDRLRGLFSAGGGPVREPGVGLSSGLSPDVADSEPLARFLRSSKLFSAQKKIVKPAAFLPNPRDGKTSVFRHPGAPAAELWALGCRKLGEDARIHGAGIVRARDARVEGLEVAASEPPPRHANIEGWPTDGDPELQKAARKEAAIALAARAKLLLREP